MKEDKQAICDALCETLRLTRQFSDLDRIEYTKSGEAEWATCYLPGGKVMAAVTWDSGIAMIRDILRALR